MGLALTENATDFVRLPSGRPLRETKVKVVEIGSLHSFFGKGVE